MQLDGRRVVISGGSKGIGKAAALRLAARGCRLALLARGRDALDAACAEARAAGAPVVVGIVVDVTDDGAVARAAAEAVEALGGVDLLVANQGYARCDAVADAELAVFAGLLDTNFLGHVRLVKALLPALREGGGAICLVSSMLGFMSFHGYGAYAASKFAIVGFAEALRQEVLTDGVTVSVFYPPTTDTPGLEAENATKPALTWAIEGTSRQFTAEQVADAMLRGVTRGRFVHMVGLDSWLIYYASRWLPGLVRFVLDREVRAHAKQTQGR